MLMVFGPMGGLMDNDAAAINGETVAQIMFGTIGNKAQEGDRFVRV